MPAQKLTPGPSAFVLAFVSRFIKTKVTVKTRAITATSSCSPSRPIVADRLSAWAEPFFAEEQNGFRRHRGTDDAHQTARRIIEEVVVSDHDRRVAVTSFDIVRAYTRVHRCALWLLLQRLGVPSSFLNVLKALHDRTQFQVFIHNGYSTPWLTDPGLREGCPSSPVLFNIFHTFVLRTFRCRRAANASAHGMVPGLSWAFKVDGRLTRSGAGKTSSRGVHSVVLGDVEYADDTQIFGEQDEVSLAEDIFVQTLHDWAQQEHPDKREKLSLCAGGRGHGGPYNQFERKMLKHLGCGLVFLRFGALPGCGPSAPIEAGVNLVGWQNHVACALCAVFSKVL